MTLRIELFLQTLTVNPFSQIWFTLSIQSFWTFFNMTHRIGSKLNPFKKTWFLEIEPFQHDSKKVSFFSLTQRIFLFDTMYDSKNKLIVFWKIWHIFLKIWRTELNISFLEYDAQNWTSLFSNMTHRIEHLFSRIWRTELNLFFNLTLRNESFFLNVTRRNEHFLIWLAELNLFFECDSKNCNFLQKVSPRMDFLECDSKNWIFFNMTQRIGIDSKHWTAFFNMTQEIEHLFSRIWRTELNISFLEYDAQNWTSFLEYDAQNWTSHLFSNMTHRIFFEYDSQNWMSFPPNDS